MSDQYTPGPTGLRQVPPVDYVAPINPAPGYANNAAPAYNSRGYGFGPALTVVMVFIVVAIIASVLPDFTTNTTTEINGSATVEAPAN